MAYPNYVTTRVVSVGGAIGLESSELLTISAFIEASRSLVRADTGYRFEVIGTADDSAVGSEVSFTLPVTDQAGWRDAKTGSLIDVTVPDSYTHQYTATVKIMRGTRTVRTYTVGPFVLPTGEGVIDLDQMVPASTVQGGLVQVPDLWGQLVSDAQAAAVAAEASLIDSDAFIASKVTDTGSATGAALAAQIGTAVDGAVAGAASPFIYHGFDANTSRGGSTGNRVWVGWVKPLNKIDGQDVWLKTTALPEPSFVLGDIEPFALWRASDVPGNPGDTITTWPDSSSNTYNLTGVGAVLRQDMDGQRFVEFNGTTHALANADVDLAINHTVIVARFVNRTEGQAGHLVGGRVTSWGHLILANTTPNPDKFAAFSGTYLNSTVDADTAWHVHRASYHSSSGTYGVDDAPLATGGTGSAQMDGLSVGFNVPTSVYTALEVKAIAIYQTGIGVTSQMLTDLVTECMAYYGIGG